MTGKKTQFSIPGLIGISRYDLNNKEVNAHWYIRYFLSRTQTMFEYENLPDTIPQTDLERLIQCNGFACVAECNGALYAFYGGLGGEPNPYYLPTICTVANPALNLSKMFKINEDCVIIKNDSYYNGLLPLISRYAVQLAENDISIKIADINSRIVSLITAPDGNSKIAAEKYLEKICNGELGIAADDDFIKGISVQPYANASVSGTLTDLIELQQYLKASCFNELGINSNYNMKRESLNSEESQLNHDALIPLVDDMLQCRKRGIKAVNEMFKTDIKVKIGGVWRDRHKAESSGYIHAD